MQINGLHWEMIVLDTILMLIIYKKKCLLIPCTVQFQQRRNSEEVPQWMGRTQRYYSRNSVHHQKSIHQDPQTNFNPIVRKNIYQNQPIVPNPAGQFQFIAKKRGRSHWQMKNHTFQLEWPKKMEKSNDAPQESSSISDKFRISQMNKTTLFGTQRGRSTNRRQKYFRFDLPKYGIRQSPLHLQKATPIKIGHSAMIDSIVIK